MNMNRCKWCGETPVLAGGVGSSNIDCPKGGYSLVACVNEDCVEMPVTSGGNGAWHDDKEAVEEWNTNNKKYVKLVVKPTVDSWFKPNTEVWCYDAPRRITIKEWNGWVESGMVLVRGIRPNGKIDGESCSIDEFIITETNSDIKLAL